MDVPLWNTYIAGLIVIIKGFLVVRVQVLPSLLVDLPQAHQRIFITFRCLLEIINGSS